MYDLHVRSVARLAELTLPVIAAGRRRERSSSCRASSGLRGNRVLSGYGVTKAANAQLVRNIAVQWGGRGIRANAISPGVIATDFARPITDDADAAPRAPREDAARRASGLPRRSRAPSSGSPRPRGPS